MTQIVALFIAVLIPLVFLYLIYTLDLYKTGAFRYVMLCFVWGGLAYAGAFFVNPAVAKYFHLDWDTQVVRYIAPVAEEILKALILLYLVRLPSFTYFVDGAIYGFAAGIGFAVFENYQYIASVHGQAFNVAISRVLSTNLMHASASAIVGIVLGMTRFRRFSGRVVFIVFGLATAMGLHTLYNNLVTRVNVSLLLVVAIAIGFSGAGFIAFMIKRGLAEEKTWIEETLGAADRVTAGEKAVVRQLENVGELLEPLAQRFGEEKATQIEKFLVVQARLGILRKTLEKLTDDKMRKAVEKQMGDLRQEMDAARRTVGSYAMLYLRHTIPPDASPLWGRLETLIQDRIASRPEAGGMNVWEAVQEQTSSRPATGGTSLWSNMQQRAKPATDKGKKEK
jgi:RsiW-degrading membrane proteinase PrsW (M82 family)